MDTRLLLLSHALQPEQIHSGLLSISVLLSHPAAGASLLSNVSAIQIKLQGAPI